MIEKRKEHREKSKMTSAKEKVVGQRRRGPRFYCSEGIKRAAESDEKRAARLKQQEIFIPQWSELAIIDYIICIYPSSASIALKMF